jgi:two-component system cell cycle response regulator DivK
MSHAHALIIDDNRLNIQVLAMLLEQEAFSYVATDSIRQVAQLLDQQGAVDIVFLDLEFPNGDGFSLLGTLKADSRLKGVPIVAYSVHTGEMSKAQRAGFHSFIGKPLNSKRFPNQLQRILNGIPVWEV